MQTCYFQLQSGHLLSLLKHDECVHSNGDLAPLICPIALLALVSRPYLMLLFKRLLLYLCNYQMYIHYSDKEKLVIAVVLPLQTGVNHPGNAVVIGSAFAISVLALIFAVVWVLVYWLTSEKHKS